jgi:hypothetical protein
LHSDAKVNAPEHEPRPPRSIPFSIHHNVIFSLLEIKVLFWLVFFRTSQAEYSFYSGQTAAQRDTSAALSAVCSLCLMYLCCPCVCRRHLNRSKGDFPLMNINVDLHFRTTSLVASSHWGDVCQDANSGGGVQSML